MTAFFIVLVIFLCAAFVSRVNANDREAQYKKSITSNAKLEFDIGCEVIKKMGEEYRRLSSYKTFEERFGKPPEQDLDKVKGYLELKCLDGRLNVDEEKWLYATACASGIPLNNDMMKEVYSKNIWDEIPKKMSEEFKTQWKEKYHPNISNENLDYFLTESILYKNKIIYNICYHCYNDSEIINTIAIQFNMPSENELHDMGELPFPSIGRLASVYASMEVQRKGFCPTIDMKIVPDPTDEERLEGYACVSRSESENLKSERRAELYRKYYGNKDNNKK